MDFDNLVDRLTKRLREPLPGIQAHEPLRATPAGTLLPKFEHKVPPRPGSVLIVLYPEQQSIVFPLIKRPAYLGAHSDQVSFPGGKAEPGENVIETALREAEEEIGISRNSVTVLGTLSEFFVIPSNFMVTPVVGISTQIPNLIPDPTEVARILHGDVMALTEADSIKTTEILAAGRYRMKAPHFEIEGEVVWGATAMMLNEFRWILREII